MSHVEATDIKMLRVQRQSNKTSHFMCLIPLPCYYMQLNMSKNVDALEWWSAKTQQLPLLRQLASKYLSIPATSAAPSERCFSSAGLTLNNFRIRLSGEHLEALNVLQCNKVLL